MSRTSGIACALIVVCCTVARANETAGLIGAALERAGANRPQLQQALDQVPAEQRASLEFLIAYMPQRDLEKLSAEFLMENVEYAHRALAEAPWNDAVPQDIFLNDVLPYANINEGRDRWRKKFYEQFRPLVAEAQSPSQAAAILNREIFPRLQVRYSTARRRADQAPFESIDSGLASCTGLSILLIDACRAVGVPARFAGTPLWSNNSGNHSWVEVWDNGWHFTGAAEPTGDQLDQAWFIGNAAAANRDERRHAIYAVSYKRTPITFPLVWDPAIDYVFAVNVTDRYTARAEAVPEGHVKVLLRTVRKSNGQRCRMPLTIKDAAGQVLLADHTKDEQFDSNDHLVAVLPADGEYSVEIEYAGRVICEKIRAQQRNEPVTLIVDDVLEQPPPPHSAIMALQEYLAKNSERRSALAQEPFAKQPLTREEAAEAARLLWEDHVAAMRRTRAPEMEARQLSAGELVMPFYYRTFGECPQEGRSLYISLHGGGGAPAAVNDRQWENQKRLYELTEGVYVAPRAPTNTWDLWHQAHIDRLFARLIENMIVFENVNPNRVYLLGYSAGGDGVYQVTPRMADYWAAASMMAGHPNETSPLGLRNVPFAIHVGELDAAYNRNEVAKSWQQQLETLHAADPEGYLHVVKIYPGKGHWLDREDAAAIPWMAQYIRNPLPSRIVWKQDDVTRTRFYWLSIPPPEAKPGNEIVVQRRENQVLIEKCSGEQLTIHGNDALLNLDEPISIKIGEQTLFEGPAVRTIAALAESVERGDPHLLFSAQVSVDIPAQPSGTPAADPAP